MVADVFRRKTRRDALHPDQRTWTFEQSKTKNIIKIRKLEKMEPIITEYVRDLIQGYFDVIVKKFALEKNELIKVYARTIELYKGENKKPIQRAKSVNVEQENRDIIKKLRTQDIRRIVKNNYGNFEDGDGLVWSKETSKVIGRQVGDSVRRLTSEDIEICRSKFLEYDTRMVE
jgi:hypothetical protein